MNWKQKTKRSKETQLYEFLFTSGDNVFFFYEKPTNEEEKSYSL